MGAAASAERFEELRAQPADGSDICNFAAGTAAVAELRSLIDAAGQPLGQPHELSAPVAEEGGEDEDGALLAMQAEVARLRAVLVGAVETDAVGETAPVTAAVPDPWAAVSPDAQWELLLADDVRIVALDAGDNAAAAVGAAPSDGDGALYLKAEGCELEGSFDFAGPAAVALRSRVVALDLAQNELDTVLLSAAAPSVCPCWLRLLSLAQNPLGTGLPDLRGCTRLLSLDVSFCDVGWSAAAFAPLTSLRRLTMEGCGLGSLLEEGGGAAEGSVGAGASLFRSLAGSLRMLNLNDNELAWEEGEGASVLAAGLAPLASTLEELDLRENDASEEGGKQYRTCVLCTLPRLKVLDNAFLKTKSSVNSLAELTDLKERMAESDEHFASQEDKSSCSCLEGNACVVKTCCRDWNNRFEVAARVRNEYAKFKQVHDPCG